MKRECESCIKRKTTYCPTSMECMATDDMPYYQNRIMLLEENQELKKQLEEHKNIYIKKVNNFLAENVEPDPEDLYMAELEQRAMDCELMEMQQKEFIKYLEDEIYNIEPKGTGINYNCEYDSEEDYVNAMKEQSRLNTLKEILQKIQRNNRGDK